MVPLAEQVGAELGLTVVNMRFVKPLDSELLLDLAASHEGFVTLEDNVVMGGAGSAVLELLAESAPRVSLVLKADIRPGFTGQLTAKVERLEAHLRDDG